MLSIYDLYDLSAIYLLIHTFPDYYLNGEIVNQTKLVLTNKDSICFLNAFRSALKTIPKIDTEKYAFVEVQNHYVYFPSFSFLKDERIYHLLVSASDSLLESITSNNNEKTADLADCLHYLSIDIATNNMSLPPKILNNELKYFRKKWDNHFLLKEQKELKKKYRMPCNKFQ